MKTVTHTIRTERLILRPFCESNHADLYEFLSQLETDEFEGYPGITLENSLAHLQTRISSGEYFATEVKETGKVIGNIYCSDREYRAKEVGYIVNQRFRRQGYAAEALSAVIEDAFRSGVHQIYAECDPRNERSWRLLEKVGFQREACLRQNISFRRDKRGKPIWKDTLIYVRLNGSS